MAVEIDVICGRGVDVLACTCNYFVHNSVRSSLCIGNTSTLLDVCFSSLYNGGNSITQLAFNDDAGTWAQALRVGSCFSILPYMSATWAPFQSRVFPQIGFPIRGAAGVNIQILFAWLSGQGFRRNHRPQTTSVTSHFSVCAANPVGRRDHDMYKVCMGAQVLTHLCPMKLRVSHQDITRDAA